MLIVLLCFLGAKGVVLQSPAISEADQKASTSRVVKPLPSSPSLPAVSLIAEDELFQYTMDCLKWLLHLKDTQRMRRLLDCADECIRVKPRRRRDALKFMRAVLEYQQGDFKQAHDLIKMVCSECPSSNVLWNFFFDAAVKADMAFSNGRFITSVKKSGKDNVHVMFVAGHHHFLLGNHVSALEEYFKAYSHCPENPGLILCIAVTYLKYALNMKTDDKRNVLTLKAFYFMEKYTELLGDSDPGSAYNIGRMYHQIGLIHYAQSFYRKALEMPQVGNSTNEKHEEAEGEHQVVKSCAAHNLAVIYVSTGANELAADIRRKHLRF